MVEEVILLPAALRDISEACQWYGARGTGLADAFLRSVDRCIDSIRRNPELYESAHEQYRRALMHRFPYAIIYEYVPGTITIYSIFHCSQDPEKWRSRLP